MHQLFLPTWIYKKEPGPSAARLFRRTGSGYLRRIPAAMTHRATLMSPPAKFTNDRDQADCERLSDGVVLDEAHEQTVRDIRNRNHEYADKVSGQIPIVIKRDLINPIIECKCAPESHKIQNGRDHQSLYDLAHIITPTAIKTIRRDFRFAIVL